MHEAIIQPHRPRKQPEAKVFAIRGQVGMIRRDERFIEEAGSRDSSCAKDNGIDEVNDVRIKFAQASHEKGTKEVEFELGIKRERKSGGADKLGPGVFLHP